MHTLFAETAVTLCVIIPFFTILLFTDQKLKIFRLKSIT